MKKTTKPCEAPTAESGYNDGSSDHTLPSGRTITVCGEMDLFEAWNEHLTEIREALAEVVRVIDHAYMRNLKRYRKLAEKRGRIRIIWGDRPVDVCFTPKAEAMGSVTPEPSMAPAEREATA